MRLNTYQSSRLYKEWVKAYHDKKLLKRSFQPGQQVLLFNFSRDNSKVGGVENQNAEVHNTTGNEERQAEDTVGSEDLSMDEDEYDD